MSGGSLIRADLGDGVRLLRLNRPQKRNAIDRELYRRLIAEFDALDGDAAVRAVVLTGSDPAFCGGVDLIDAADPELVAERRRDDDNPAAAARRAAVPVIAAVNGPCVTGGLELLLSCDFALASDRAVFADTHAQLGMVPAWGGAALLPEAVGLRRAKEMALTGRFVDAGEAREIGLVAAVVPHERLLGEATEVARRIAAAPAEKVAATRSIYDGGVGLDRADRLRLERSTLLATSVDTSGAGRRLSELSGSD
jgi:enoyl-CoA hydratase/carnithine racemase